VSLGQELLGVLARVVGTLDRRRLPYFVTGSFAASVHGEFRATNDVDLVVQLGPEDARGVVEDLMPDFIGDGDAAAHAAGTGASFNLIHLETLLKVDVFSARGDLNTAALARAVALTLADGMPAVRFASVEDVLVAKMRWYALGGRESAVQRRDIEGLIRLNRERIDWEYVREAVRRERLESVGREFEIGMRSL
jgi:hypothetical protein